MIRILLAMPNGLLRGALRYVLSTQPDIEVVAERDTVPGASECIPDNKPDVVVLDLALLDGAGPVVDAARAAEHALTDLAGCKVIVLVDPRRPGFGSQLAETPPEIGFLAQTAPPERVVDAIRRMARDKVVVDPDLLTAALAPRSPFTAKELQVLNAAALGWPVKDIAAHLSLSPGTVRNHLSRIIAKTGARNRIEAVHLAQQAGWI